MVLGWVILVAVSPPGSQPPRGPLAGIIALLAGCAWRAVASALWWTEGRVLVTHAGLRVCDWLGRTRSTCWCDVRELRVTALLAGVPDPYGSLQLRGSFDPVRVPLGLRRQDWVALRDLLIERAGLTKKQTKWWGALYTRPTG
jgi:hypothetical protein